MFNFPIGAMLESFKLPTRDAIKQAASIGAKGIQMHSTYGEHSPEQMTDEKIKELLAMMNDSGLVFSAICGDLGHGFGHAELNAGLVEKSKRILDLAKKLGTNVVTTHIGVVPTDPSNPRYEVMRNACLELAEYADSMDAHFAIETGPETAVVLKQFLDSLDSHGVAVNLDPANLAMVVGDDPVKAVYTLRDYIVHTHAKDGKMLYRKNPEMIYGVIPDTEKDKGSAYAEMPLGQGSVDYPAYLAALDDIGYRGFLTIERECGDTPVDDIKMAADFLRGIIG